MNLIGRLEYCKKLFVVSTDKLLNLWPNFSGVEFPQCEDAADCFVLATPVELLDRYRLNQIVGEVRISQLV